MDVDRKEYLTSREKGREGGGGKEREKGGEKENEGESEEIERRKVREIVCEEEI